MKTIHDSKFLAALFRECGQRVPATALAQLRVEVSDYGRRAGFQVDICDAQQPIASVGWSPEISDTAYVIEGLDTSRMDEDRLTELVRDFIKTHCHGMTEEEAGEIVLLHIAAFGEAVAAKDWTYARNMWKWLEPLHPKLFANDPSLAHVAAVLEQNEALASTASNTIH